MSSNGFVGAADFFGDGFKRRFREVPLPGGRKARIRNLSEREKVAYEQASVELKPRKGETTTRARPDARALLVAMCLVDADGNQLFPEFEKVRQQFMDMDGAVTAILWDSCLDLCGFGEDSRQQLVESFEEASASAS